MAITLAAGFPLDAHANPGAVTSFTTPMTPVTIGDLMVVYVRIGNTSKSVSSLSGGGCTGWAKIADLTAGAGNYVSLFSATVSATGAQTLTVTFAAALTATDSYAVSQLELTGYPSWGVAVSGTKANGTSSLTVTYPSLTATSGSSAQAYIGAGTGTTTTSATNGTPTGFVYDIPGTWDVTAYNLALTPGSAYAPTVTQATSGVSDTVAAIIYGNVPQQFLRPSADITTTGWTTTPLWSKLNDSSDSTFVTSTV